LLLVLFLFIISTRISTKSCKILYVFFYWGDNIKKLLWAPMLPHGSRALGLIILKKSLKWDPSLRRAPLIIIQKAVDSVLTLSYILKGYRCVQQNPYFYIQLSSYVNETQDYHFSNLEYRNCSNMSSCWKGWRFSINMTSMSTNPFPKT